MKWNKQMARNAEAWVAKYGLLEYGGTLKDFCVSMGISDDTYYRWTDEQGKSYKSEFCEAIKKGQEAYKATLTFKAESKLLDLIEGAETTNERTELLPDAQGKPVITKRVVTKTKDAPNVTAIIFALSNLKPEQWKNRQSTEVKADIKQQKQLSVQEARDFINQIEKEI